MLRFRPSKLEAADPSQSALPARTWPTACGSAWVTSSIIALLRYSDEVLSQPPPQFDHNVPSKVLVDVEGSPAFYLVADRHPLKGAGDQELVLVDLRTRLMTQSRMPYVCVHRTTVREPRRQELLYPQKASSRGHKIRRWDDPGRVGGSRPQQGGRYLVPIGFFAGPWRNLSSPCPRVGCPCSAGVSFRGALP